MLGPEEVQAGWRGESGHQGQGGLGQAGTVMGSLNYLKYISDVYLENHFYLLSLFVSQTKCSWFIQSSVTEV